MTKERNCSRRDGARLDSRLPLDAGIGLIEIVISIFLISLLAIATRLVAQALDAASEPTPEGCAVAQSRTVDVRDAEEVVDAQGVTLRVTTAVTPVDECVAAGELLTGTVIAVDVADVSETPIAATRTQIFLGGTP